jgi:hypothetical protein
MRHGGTHTEAQMPQSKDSSGRRNKLLMPGDYSYGSRARARRAQTHTANWALVTAPDAFLDGQVMGRVWETACCRSRRQHSCHHGSRITIFNTSSFSSSEHSASGQHWKCPRTIRARSSSRKRTSSRFQATTRCLHRSSLVRLTTYSDYAAPQTTRKARLDEHSLEYAQSPPPRASLAATHLSQAHHHEVPAASR